ncbi:MAG: hypothetical protein K5669_10730 [Lachnospiraceae bacterium]|nr:hypothetical protein [Lachnospiraceae bacterium]
MRKILGKKLSAKFIAIALGVVLIIAIIPLLVHANYMIPWYDDYGYAKYNRSFRLAYGDNLISLMRGVFFQVKESWWSWQGTFSSIFLMALCPIAWGEQYYRFGGMALIILFAVSVVFMMYALCKEMFGIKKTESFCIAFATALLTIEKMYFPGHAFYWYNGGVHYIGIHSFLMLFVGVIVLLSAKKGVLATILQVFFGMILALIVSGGNYVSLLEGAIILVALVLYVVVKYKKRAFRMLPIVAVFIAGFYINATAPGNSVRSAFFAGSAHGPVESVLLSFPDGAKMIGKFSDIFLIVILAALIPIIWNGLRESKVRFRFPIIFVIFVCGLYFATYTAPLYGMGSVQQARIWNVCKLMYQLALILSEIYVIGWIHRVVREKQGKLSLNIGYWWFYGLCIAAVLIVFAHRDFERYDYASYGAAYDTLNHESGFLYGEYLDRIEQIKSQGPDVLVEPYRCSLWYLRQTDISENAWEGPNIELARWYGKNSIALIDTNGK